MRRVQIRKVATLGTGHTPSRSVPEYWVPEECTIPWLTLADVWQVRDGTKTVVTETKEKISPAGVVNSSAVVHPAGTVAFSRTASVGFSCILGTDMATSQDWVTWTCGPHLDPRYLLWVLRGDRDQILGRTQGSTHKTIYMPDIEELTIPLPPIEEQRRIGRRLDNEMTRLDEVARSKAAIAALVEERVSAEVEFALADAATAEVPLRRLAEVTVGIVINPSTLVDPDGEVPFFRGLDVRPYELDTVNAQRMTRETCELHAKSTLRPGDLVVVRVGDPGVAAVVPSSVPIANCASLLVVRPRPEVRPEYLCHYINSRRGREAVRSMSAGAAQLQVNASDIVDLAVPWGGVEAQANVLSRVDQVWAWGAEVRQTLGAQGRLFRERRSALLADQIVNRAGAA